ncbi:MAG: hypothetical protein JWP97_6367 [Labilithrix sp.]|nr:hypothetical protein [Labilithrix sp.]
MKARPALPWLAALTVLLAACPTPGDGTPQIAVSPNAAGRMRLLPGARGGHARGGAAAGRAYVRPLKEGEALGGPNATGKQGDWLLGNDEVVFVVEALGPGSGFAESGGNLLDAADAHLRKDELGQIFTNLGPFPRQAVYSSLDAREDGSGAAILVAKGHELYDAKLAVETRYQLASGDRALLLTTILTNHGDREVSLKWVGDAVQWGGAEKVASGKPVGFKGRSEGPFLGGVGRFASYAITSAEGSIAALSGSSWSDTEQQKDVKIAPGASLTYVRVLVVGERADVASLVSELTKSSGEEVGAVEISLVDAAGRPVKVPQGARATVSVPGGAPVMTLVADHDDATFGGELPPGTWELAFAPSVGRRAASGAKVTVNVAKGGAQEKATLVVSDAAELDASCVDEAKEPLPCKVTIVGTDGTPDPDLGPTYVSGPATNQIIGEHVVVPIAPGTYRLTFTRGPEYGLEAVVAVLAPGARKTLVTTLKRVVDTSGYVSTDFHQHSILSGDAPVSTRDRLRANAAEGVEVAVASEHNRVVDLEPLARELGLARFVVAIAGDELTTDASVKPWGHANVFPLVPAPGVARGGAPAVRDRLASDVLDEVRRRPGPARVIQINHPRAAPNGYFDLLAFDAQTGLGTGAGYDPGFDAVEVWNGKDVAMRDKVLVDFLALLRTGHPVTPVADTDTHGIVGQEPGLPRTFVRVTKDDGLDAWDAGRTDDLVRSVRERRDVVLTNGPFLEVRANGAGIGGVAAAKGGLVEVKVHVVTASFAQVSRAELRLAGPGQIVGASTVTLMPQRNAAGAYEARATFTVRAPSDDAFIVTVAGDRPMRPMFSGDDDELRPWAMSGAVWIDADGDGKSLGRTRPAR